MKRLLLLAFLLAAASARAQGDPERGRKLLEDCYPCHGYQLYLPPKAKVRRLKYLREATRRWADFYNPAFTKQDVEDMLAYLDRDFYQLKK